MSATAEQIHNPAAPPVATPEPAAPAAPVAAVPDRRATLAAAFDKKEAPAAVASAPPPVAAPPVKAEAKPDATPRGPDGKFVPKSADAAPAPVTTPEPAPVQSKQWKLPKSWKHDIEPVFSKLASNPEFEPLLAEIERREADVEKGFAKYHEKAEFADTIQQAMQPFMATIQSLGVQPHVAVQHLLAADHMLRYGTPGEKARALQNLSQQYNIDLAGLQEVAAANPPPPPELVAVRSELQQLKAQQQRAAVEAVTREVQAFATGKEHFADVETDMAKLISSGVAADLDAAYDMACWARPDVREKMVAKQREQAQADTRAAEQKAQAAAVSVAGAPVASASGSPSPKDRRALIASLMDK